MTSEYTKMVKMFETIEQVAKVCHEANRAYCETLGDNSQPIWASAPNWQKDSARNGVKFHFAQLAKGVEPSPSASHEKWLEQKRAEGWKYGQVKDAVKKEHPCFVEYAQLPLDQRRKDYIFAAICKAFAMSRELEPASSRE
jgi:RyR domain